MVKLRLLLVGISAVIITLATIVLSFYAKGYRFNKNTLRFEPKGILLVKSDPSGAQIFINSEYRQTSEANISLAPGIYDVTVKKEGFIPWEKRLTIEKESVTEIFASLFKTAPSLSPVTFDGVENPVASSDYTKLAYFVPVTTNDSQEKTGLYVIENLNLPIGFVKDPKKITDGLLTAAKWQFSPDGNEILLETKQGIFLLSSGSFTAQADRTNIASKLKSTLEKWQQERQKKTNSKLRPLPDELEEIFVKNTKVIEFSPDNKKILYIASGSAELKQGIVKQLPGASTQKQERYIKDGQIYVYDIKEDRNFLISETSNTTILDSYVPTGANKRIAWFPNSTNLVLAKEGKIIMMDYDGTNQKEVFSGAYINPSAFPFASTQQLLILTNLGADSSTPNLYSLTIK